MGRESGVEIYLNDDEVGKSNTTHQPQPHSSLFTLGMTVECDARYDAFLVFEGVGFLSLAVSFTH